MAQLSKYRNFPLNVLEEYSSTTSGDSLFADKFCRKLLAGIQLNASSDSGKLAASGQNIGRREEKGLIRTRLDKVRLALSD